MPVVHTQHFTQGQCSTCNLPTELRAGVERLLNEGAGVRTAEKWLLERGVDIARTAIWRHRTNHMPVLAEVQRRVAEVKAEREAQQKADLKAEVMRAIAEVEGLDDVYAYAKEVAAKVKDKVMGGAYDMTDAMLLKWMLVEMREAIKAKHELVNGKKLTLNHELDGLFGLLSAGHVPGGKTVDAEVSRHAPETSQLPPAFREQVELVPEGANLADARQASPELRMPPIAEAAGVPDAQAGFPASPVAMPASAEALAEPVKPEPIDLMDLLK